MMFDAAMLNIGSQKQLFLDDLLIESAENVCRTWHQPEKYSNNPVLRRDREWEHVLELTVNGFQVHYDAKDQRFKCWYLDTNLKGIVAGGNVLGETRYNTLYAESADGVNWVKPFTGNKVDGLESNAIIIDGYNLTAVIDPWEQDVNQRYKGLFTPYLPGQDVDGVRSVTSADGIRWNVRDEKPSFGRRGQGLDDVMVMSYDPLGRLFILNTRHYDMYAVHRNLANPVVGQFTPPYYPLDWQRMNKRRLWQAESANAVHWSEPYIVVPIEDGREGLDETFYGMSQCRIGDVALGFVTTFQMVSDQLGVKLVYSRNGKHWEHLNNRQQLIPWGGKGAWDEFMATMPSPPIEYKDELYFFYGGAVNHHDWWIVGAREGLDVPEARDLSKVAYAIGLARLRLDGFASLDAGVRPGILITRHFLSGGRKLVVNARCRSGGSIRAEVADGRDEVLPGFGKDDCDVFSGDCVRHLFTWQGRSILPAVPRTRPDYPAPEIERLRKIRFYLDQAELYSFMLAD
jgi:hypothetical protein